jgi:hypothetical protein
MRTPLRLGIAVVALSHLLPADAQANPYAGVAQRNSFGLLKPTEPAVLITNTPPPAVRLELTGVVTVGQPCVLLTRDTPANPSIGQPAEEISLVLFVDEPPVEGLQVVEIQDHSDPRKVTVTVLYNGKELVLPLSRNRPTAAGLRSP